MAKQPKELDFIWRLNGYIKTLGLYADSDVGVLAEGDSISVMAMPGGEGVIFHDGTRDKNYQMQVNAKSDSQFNCIEALSKVATTLERIQSDEIKSVNGSFDFDEITITSPVSIIAHDEQGYFIYGLSISARITIYEE